MNDYTETQHTSWFGRIKNAFMGMIFGLIAVIGAFVLLSWNEGESVETAKSIEQGRNDAISVAADDISPTNDQKLVHFNGMITTSQPLRDRDFGVEQADAIRLIRRVEMYQWIEDKRTKTEDKLGGGQTTTTTYSYKEGWSSKPERHENRNVGSQYANPQMRIEGDTWTAGDAMVGAYRIPPNLLSGLGDVTSIATSSITLAPAYVQQFQQDGKWFTSSRGSSPKIGDYRIAWDYVPVIEASFMGAQRGNTLAEYATIGDETIYRADEGILTIMEMAANMDAENAMLTWGLRFGGFFLMFIGFMMLMAPLKALAMVIPPLGNVIGMGTGLISFVLALCLSLITIAIAWIAVRPLIGIPLLLVGVGALLLPKLLKRGGNAGPQADFATGGSPPPPPPRM